METIEKEEKLDFEKIMKIFQETDRRLDQRIQETDKRLDQRIQETDKDLKARFRETDKLLKELGKQIGGLGNKFGSFTEGLFFPSLKSILEKKFKVTNINQNLISRRGDENIEVDVLGYTNGPVNIAYIVEIKSHLQLKHINQVLNIINKFRTHFPEHKDKKLFGMIASIQYTNELKQSVLDSGLYFVKIQDDTFKLDTPDDFKPIEF